MAGRSLRMLALGASAAGVLALGGAMLSRAQSGQPGPARVTPLSEPFKGITTDGTVVAGLFPIRATGVSTGPVRAAALSFLEGLTREQRAKTRFPVDDPEWRDWSNIHRYPRQGVSFEEMNEAQRDGAYGLLRASLSARGLDKSRNIMRLNHHLAELVDNFEAYGEFLYWITVFGEPAEREPWGWQLEGHHLLITYLVLGDQVVMTPTFMGSEPVIATSGKYAGTAVLQEEQDKGLTLMESFDPEQRRAAVISAEKIRNDAQAQAFTDNLVLAYAGIRATSLDDRQRALLLDLIGEYVGNMSPGHAKVRMDEVRAHLDSTYFGWIGADSPDGVFYYRVHSPVILIEFDHQTPVALPGPRVPQRRHVHTVVRTPNGNDYGKDLLRQHYEAHRHDPSHGHHHEW